MTNHDTYYYGGEILNLINFTLESMPAMDRGGIYIWVAHGGDRIIYCNMRENDGRGSLEVYEGGRFRDQIDYNGILTWNEDETDYYFTEERKKELVHFLEKHLNNGK